MYPRVPYSKYCMRGEVERIIKHEVKLSVLLLLDTTTQVQYECKARAKGTLTGLLCVETIPLASVTVSKGHERRASKLVYYDRWLYQQRYLSIASDFVLCC